MYIHIFTVHVHKPYCTQSLSHTCNCVIINILFMFVSSDTEDYKNEADIGGLLKKSVMAANPILPPDQ